MKKILLVMLAGLFCFGAWGWYPSKKTSEIRLIGQTQGGIGSGDYSIEGQLLGAHVLNDNFHLGGVFKMSPENKDSKLGAMLTYSINKYVFISLSGDLSSKNDIGGEFILHGNFDVSAISFMPFAKINHNKIGEVGLITYFDLGGVMFSLGGGYKPPQGEDKHHNMIVLVGTGVKIK